LGLKITFDVRHFRASKGGVRQVGDRSSIDDRGYLGIAAVTGQPVKIITET